MSATGQSILLDNNGRKIPQVYDPPSDTYRALSGNTESGALITHAAASAGVNSADQVNVVARGLHLVIDITTITGTTPTLTVTIEGKDPTSGKYYTILASAALNATGTTVLKVYPGLTASANAVANDVLPRTWRVRTTIGGTTPAVTATIAANLID
jgi:hypothetical protein